MGSMFTHTETEINNPYDNVNNKNNFGLDADAYKDAVSTM